MLNKTRGIILQTIHYNDTSLIVKAYTELLGLQSFIINGIRKKRPETKINALQPLSLVEMVIYHKQHRQLNRVKEIRTEYPFTTIPYDITKSSIVLFLNEIIYKSIKEEETNTNLFDFLSNSIKILDLKSDSCANFHLLFMLQFSRHLGFFPQGSFSESTPFFDLQLGAFQKKEPVHSYYLSPKQSSSLSELMFANYDTFININNTLRRKMLEKLILFYELHIPGVLQISSHRILEEVVA